MANRTDNFNRANDSSSIGTPSDSGGAWSVTGGTWGITSNTLYRSAGTGYSAAYLDSGVSAGTITATFSALASSGIAMRIVDGSNFVWLQLLSGTIYLWKRVSGTFTQLGSSYGGGYNVGDSFSLTVDSSGNWTAKRNGSTIITATDNVHNTATGVGFVYESNASQWDDLSFAEADTTAPVLSSATGTSTGSTTATVGATTDEANGTLYVVVTTSVTQPSITQIKAGQNDGGTSAAYSSSQAISSTGAKTFSATGLTASTTYYAHLVHTDAASNDSNRVTSASFTTSAGGGSSIAAISNFYRSMRSA